MKNGLISILLAGAMLVACGSSDVTIGTRASTSTTEADGGPNASTNANDTSPPAKPGPCGADELCLDVVPIRPGTKPLAGRLAIFWYQVTDDGPDPSWKVVYDVAFTGKETRIVVPRTSLAPPDDVHILCERSCQDESACPCIGPEKAGVGMVAVFLDDNGNGAVDLTNSDKTSETLIGVGRVGLSYSDVAQADAGRLSGLFPDGIPAGIQWHKIEPRPVETYWDAMRVVPPGTVFELRVCDTTDRAQCDVWGEAPDYN